MIYEFGVRFRRESEIEGLGSFLFKVLVPDGHLSNVIRRTVSDIVKQHPTTVFDGVIFYGAIEN